MSLTMKGLYDGGGGGGYGGEVTSVSEVSAVRAHVGLTPLSSSQMFLLCSKSPHMPQDKLKVFQMSWKLGGKKEKRKKEIPQRTACL